MASRSRGGLGQQQPEARGAHSHGPIGRPGLCANQIGEGMRGAIKEPPFRPAYELKQHDRCRPSISGVAGRLLEKRGCPVGPRIEFLREPRPVQMRFCRSIPLRAGRRSIEEGDDLSGRPLVVGVGQDETSGPARRRTRRGGTRRGAGTLVDRITHGLASLAAATELSLQRPRAGRPCALACPPGSSRAPPASRHRRASARSERRRRTPAGGRRTACRGRR